MADDKDWIAGAVKKPGALHAELGVKKGDKIPVKTLRRASKKGGKLAQRANFALAMHGLRRHDS
jgi:hypothetical protein